MENLGDELLQLNKQIHQMGILRCCFRRDRLPNGHVLQLHTRESYIQWLIYRREQSGATKVALRTRPLYIEPQ